MNKKILIVDDNKNNLRLLQNILEDEDFHIITISNSLEVVDIAIMEKPTVILLDIMMPELDGFEVCNLLKKQPETYDLPVIMVTAKTDAKDLKAALDLGAFDYIKKPIDEVEVIARVQSAIRYKQQQDILKEMAFRDGLTGLFNHSLLIELFEKEFKKCKCHNHNISFLMLDIDHFKQVNDTYGHLVGDMLLKQLADILMSSTRATDIVGRYGGEEFGIVLAHTDSSTALLISEKIRQITKDKQFDINSNKIQITLSCGIYSTNCEATITYMEALKRADEALYEAKQKGRDRVKLYHVKSF